MNKSADGSEIYDLIMRSADQVIKIKKCFVFNIAIIVYLCYNIHI